MRLEVAGALSAAVAIGAAAFGAHGVEGPAREWLQTGGQYQLVHSVAVIVIAKRAPAAAFTLLAGSLIFAGALYGLAFGGPRWLGGVAPIGGATMIAGWLVYAFRAFRQRSEQ